jgi:hypothetical protein
VGVSQGSQEVLDGTNHNRAAVAGCTDRAFAGLRCRAFHIYIVLVTIYWISGMPGVTPGVPLYAGQE